jgi:mannitol-1-/sugar-/sorbitol-6-phosphatase
MIRLRCAAMLFDLDGVLVDSRSCVERHWHRWAARHGLDLAHVLAEAHGRRTVDTIRAVAPALDVEREATVFEEAEAADVEGIVALPGALDLLTALPESRWAVVTSGSRPLALGRLHATGLPVPPCLVTADDVDEGKPDPQGYLRAAGLLGRAPRECVVVEDTPAGIAAAQAASMRSIAVATTHPREALLGADVCIASLAELRPHSLG